MLAGDAAVEAPCTIGSREFQVGSRELMPLTLHGAYTQQLRGDCQGNKSGLPVTGIGER
jgi:hypothetical protein